MDELGLNKLFAGFLFAGLLLLSGVQLGNILVPKQKLSENAYVIEVAETSQTTEIKKADDLPKPILALLASADLGAGEKLAKKCTACHAFGSDGKAKVGPALWNIVNKKKGADSNFKYSAALTAHGGAWDYQSLNAFLAKPKDYISGTKMNFAGLKKPVDRANIIAWMREQADEPVALPTTEEIAAENKQ